MTRALLIAVMAVSLPALAQDDAPIPYGDEGDEAGQDGPKKSKRTRERLREEDESEEAGEETLAHLDDPNLGVGGTFMSGLMLFESATTRKPIRLRAAPSSGRRTSTSTPQSPDRSKVRS